MFTLPVPSTACYKGISSVNELQINLLLGTEGDQILNFLSFVLKKLNSNAKSVPVLLFGYEQLQISSNIGTKNGPKKN